MTLAAHVSLERELEVAYKRYLINTVFQKRTDKNQTMNSTANVPEASENVVSFAAVIRVVTSCVILPIFPYPSQTLQAVPSTFRFKT